MHYQIYFFLAVTADEFKIVTKHDDKNCERYLIRGESMRTFVTITLKLVDFGAFRIHICNVFFFSA